MQSHMRTRERKTKGIKYETVAESFSFLSSLSLWYEMNTKQTNMNDTMILFDEARIFPWIVIVYA